MQNAGFSDNERSFNVQVGGSGNYVGTSKPQLCILVTSNCNTFSDLTYFGVYDRNLGSGCSNDNGYLCNWNWQVDFAPQCAQTAGLTSKVWVYDMDAGVYKQPELSMRVDNSSRTGALNWALGSLKKGFQQGSGKFDSYDITPSVNADTRYRLVFQDINWHNTIQLYVPYDQFDALTSVGNSCIGGGSGGGGTFTYKFSCSVDSVSPSGTLQPGQQVSISVTSKNTGTGTWDPNGTPQIRMYKDVNTDNNGYVNQGYQTLPQNPLTGGIIYPNKTVNLTFTGYAPNTYNSSRKFRFTMYRGTTAMTGTPCQTNISTGPQPSNNQPWGTIDPECTTTTVVIHTLAKDYNDQPVSQGYWTDSSPNGTAPDGNFYWNNKAPNKPSPQPPGIYSGGKGKTIIYTPPSGLPTKYYWVGDVRHVDNPAAVAPYHIEFDDINGNLVGNSPDYAPGTTPTSGGGATTTSPSSHDTFQHTWTVLVAAQHL